MISSSFLTGDRMEDYFGPEGLLKKRLANFEYRRPQSELAAKIDSFLNGEAHLLAAEAPTGVGKTFAMLVPAMRWAAENNKTVLVLTSGITLQEQLIGKDIPALIDALDLDLPYGLMKGRGNYACIRKAREIAMEGYLDFGGDKGKASRDISDWLYSTETGDLSELSLGDNHPARERIASSYLTCLGGLCPHRERCFYARVLKSAQQWRIVVANYHVFFSYVLGQNSPFPVEYGLLLCDEAHKMEEAARSVTQVGVDAREWKRMLRRPPKLSHMDATLLRIAGFGAGQFEERVADLALASETLFDQIAQKLPDGKSFSEYPEALKGDTADVLGKCDSLLRDLNELDDEASPHDFRPGDEAEGRLAVWKSELTQFRDSLRWCADVGDYPNWAYWREGEALKSSCVTGREIVPEAFDDPEIKVVALSATMTVDSSFDYWAAETGLEPDETALLDSPFDLERQMEIDVVDLGLGVMDDGYADAVARVCRKFARDNGGATLILLASRRLLNVVSSYMQQMSKKDDLNVLVQGDLPRSELLALFRENERSVLIGMASFREGIDVPGEALTQVIIDRIPFPHPGDPVGEARAQLEGRENFMKVVLPGAKMQLRQAAGRLVRTATDRGRVVILDGRIVSRPNWGILNSLPAVPIKKYRLIPPHK
ncbi:MAG: ATP-dependent DNA helicase [Pyramidobacter sp.]|nr:ATP-dependent DNA helicase [Pyramidobacter sp.]